MAVLAFSAMVPFAAAEAENEVRPMIYGTSSLAVDLDPHYAWDSASIDTIDQVMEGLFVYDLTDASLAIKPQLAADFGNWTELGAASGFHTPQWEYLVDLKTGVTFHDGSTFDAADVVFTFDRLNYLCSNETSTQITELYTPLGGVYPATPLLINKTEAITTTQVKFTLNYKFVAFEFFLCFSGSVIFAKDSVDDEQYMVTATDLLVGTGPYEHTTNEDRLTVFTAYDDYHGGIYPAADVGDITEMHWVLYDDSTTLNQAFLSGDVDVNGMMSAEFMTEYEDSEYHTVGDRIEGTSIYYMGFNCDYIGNLTRHSLRAGINYTYVIDEIGQGQVKQMTSIVPKGIMYHDASIAAPVQDVAVARQYMLDAVAAGEIGLSTTASAGLTPTSTDEAWEAVTIATYNYTYNSANSYREQIGALAKSDFAKLGIEIVITGTTWGQYLDLLDSGNVQVFMLGWGPDYNDPSNFINPLMSNTSASSSANLYYAPLQDKMDAALLEANTTRRWTIQVSALSARR